MTSSIVDKYNSVKKFNDLLKINIQYLNGIYDETCYRYGEINIDRQSLLEKLKLINRLGLYTMNSQLSKQYINWVKLPYIDRIDRNSPTYKEGISDGKWVCYQHRGYIEGLYKSKYTELLIDYLEECNDIYYIIEHKNGKIKTNIDKEVLDAQYNLSSEKDNIYLSRETYISGHSICYEYGKSYPKLVNKLFNSCIQNSYWKNGHSFITIGGRRSEKIELHDEYENILEVLHKTSSLMVITKDFNTSFSLEDLLIQFFTNYV